MINKEKTNILKIIPMFKVMLSVAVSTKSP